MAVLVSRSGVAVCALAALPIRGLSTASALCLSIPAKQMALGSSAALRCTGGPAWHPARTRQTVAM